MKAIIKQLEFAIEQDDATQAKVILTYHKQKINLDSKDQRGRTLLHKSCIQGSLPIIRLLVDQGASLEIQDKEGNTAMHHACIHDNYHVARYLLNSCADVYVRNCEGLQPVDLAQSSSLKMLLEMAMTLTSHENMVMTLGRIKKSKHNQNLRIIHINEGVNSGGGGSNDDGNNAKQKGEEKHDFTSLRSRYDEKRCSNQKSEETNGSINNKSSIRLSRRSPLTKIRRGSLNICKVKKINSFGKDNCLPPKLYNMHKLPDKKWSELQALRRVASETDIVRLVGDDHDNNFGGKMQKVTNTEEMNLVGLSISN